VSFARDCWPGATASSAISTDGLLDRRPAARARPKRARFAGPGPAYDADP
jgi:hypothetical protein